MKALSRPAASGPVADALRAAVEALDRYRLRSALSVIGVVLGVASILTVTAVIGGARQDALRQVEALGLRNLVLYNRPLAAAELERSRPQWLRWGDATALRQRVPGLGAAVAVVDRALPATGPGRTLTARVVGTTSDYPAVVPVRVARGRWWRREEEDRASRVCVIGTSLARSLFGSAEAIGAEVVIAGDWYRVIGTAAPRTGATRAIGALAARSLDDAALVPLAALAASPPHPGQRIDELWIRVTDDRRVAAAAAGIEGALARLHGGVRDFGIVVPRDLLAQRHRTQRNFAIVLAVVAAMTLLVGGIGVMNVVLTSVLERTPEIGLRRSVGARRRDLHRQFLAEAMLLTGTGGAAGVVLGFVSAWVVSRYTGWPVAVSAASVVVGLGSAVVVGLAAGVYPAVRAGAIPPVEAVRYE